MQINYNELHDIESKLKHRIKLSVISVKKYNDHGKRFTKVVIKTIDCCHFLINVCVFIGDSAIDMCRCNLYFQHSSKFCSKVGVSCN